MTELVITRDFDAPRERVYQAFVDPDQLSQWFGPVGWSVPRDTIDIDPRPGGAQRFTMVNDDDPDLTSPVTATFIEVVPGELLVGQEAVQTPDGTVMMTVRLEFEDLGGGRTRLVLRQGPVDDTVAGQAREGWSSSFTKLDALLALA
jgi:uncharacterized protein YndB with AHSA1/START domain